MPLVSVILSSYNQGDYLRTSMESILNQTFQDFEILVMDDGSQDDSQEILRSYDSDERVRLFLFHHNRGTLECIREIIPKVKGKYIAIHHSDDSWHPEKLARQVNWLETHEDDWACFTWAKIIDEEGQPCDESSQDSVFSQQNRSRQEWFRYFFYHGNCLCHPSLMIRREAYREFGLLDYTGLWQLPDFFMWVRLCRHRSIHILPERLTYFRVRRHSQESMSSDRIEMRVRDMYERSLMLDEFAKIDSQEDFLLIFPEAEQFLHEGQLDQAFAFARICLDSGQPAYRAHALNILHGLLENKDSARRLAEWYGYSEKEFIRDTGAYDAFGLKGSLPKMMITLYWATDEKYDEQHKMTQTVWITPTGHFEVIFTLPEGETAQSFILNIHEGHLAHLKLSRLSVDGKILEPVPIGRLESAEGWDIFENLHPSYECFFSVHGGCQIVLKGNIDIHEEALLKDYVQKMNDIIEAERVMADKRVLLEQNHIKEKEQELLALNGKYLQTIKERETLEQDCKRLVQERTKLEEERTRIEEERKKIEDELCSLKNSRGMRLVQSFWTARDRLLGRK